MSNPAVATWEVDIVAGARTPNAQRLGTLALCGPCSAPLTASGAPDPDLLASKDQLPTGTPVRITKDTDLEALFGSGPLVDVAKSWQRRVTDPTASLILCPTKKDESGTLGSQSLSGGATVDLDVEVQEVPGGATGPWIEADCVVKIVGMNGANPVVQYSLDNGRSWSERVRLTGAQPLSAQGPFDLSGWTSGETFSLVVTGDTASATMTPPVRGYVQTDDTTPNEDLSGASTAERTLRLVLGNADGTVSVHNVGPIAAADYSAGSMSAFVSAWNGALATAGLSSSVLASDASGKLRFTRLQYGDLATIDVDTAGSAAYASLEPFEAAVAPSGAPGLQFMANKAAATAEEVAPMLTGASWSGAEPTFTATSSGRVRVSCGDASFTISSGTFASRFGFNTSAAYSAQNLDTLPNGARSSLTIPGAGVRLFFAPDLGAQVGHQWSFSMTPASSALDGSHGFLDAMDKCRQAHLAKPYEGSVLCGRISSVTPSLVLALRDKVVAYRQAGTPQFVLLMANGDIPADLQELSEDEQANAFTGYEFEGVFAQYGRQSVFDGKFHRVRCPQGPLVATLAVTASNPGGHIQDTSNPLLADGIPDIVLTDDYPIRGADDVASALTTEHRYITTRQLPLAPQGAYWSDDCGFGPASKNLNNLRYTRVFYHGLYILGTLMARAFNVQRSDLTALSALWTSELERQLIGGGRGWCDSVKVTAEYVSGRSAKASLRISQGDVITNWVVSARIEETA